MPEYRPPCNKILDICRSSFYFSRVSLFMNFDIFLQKIPVAQPEPFFSQRGYVFGNFFCFLCYPFPHNQAKPASHKVGLYPFQVFVIGSFESFRWISIYLNRKIPCQKSYFLTCRHILEIANHFLLAPLIDNASLYFLFSG